MVAGTLSALLAFALPARQLAVERRTRDAAEQLASEAVATYKVKVHDMLIPLSLTVGEAVGAHRAAERHDAQPALRQMAVAFAAENVGPERSRACYYQLAGSAPAAARRPEELARPAQGPAPVVRRDTRRAARW